MVRASRALLVLSALLGALLAGCASSPIAVEVSKTSLTRHVTVEIDAMATDFPESGTIEERLDEFTDVSFEYKHSGETMQVAGVDVRYETTGGLKKTVPLSSLISKTSIAAGETVSFSPAGMAMTSFVILERDGQPFAQRIGAVHDWFTVGGVPMPASSSKPGVARWDLQMDGGVDIHISSAQLQGPGETTCDETGCTTTPMTVELDHADFTFSNELDATVEAQTTTPAGTTQVTFRLASLQEHAELGVDIAVETDTESIDATLDAQLDATASGNVDLTFDGSGEIAKVGGEAEFAVHATMQATGVPMGEAFPPSFDYEDTLPYHSEDVQLDDQGDASLVAFLERLWSLDLVVGDDYEFSVHSPYGDVLFTSGVLGTEARSIGTTVRPTYRIVDHFEANFPVTGIDKFAYDFTYWVDADTYLPVHEQGTFTQTFTPDDFPMVRELLEQGMAESGVSFVQFPIDSTLTVQTDASLKMVSYTGDLTQASLLTLGGARMVPVVVASSVVFVLVNNLGKGTEQKANIGFAQNQSAKTLTVASADMVDWYDIEAYVTGDGDCTVRGTMANAVTIGAYMDSPVTAHYGSMVRANDQLQVTGGEPGDSCTLMLRHAPTNQSYGIWTFNF